MSEGWSVKDENPWIGRTDLIPSNAPTHHIDPRMHLTLNDVKLEKKDAYLTRADVHADGPRCIPAIDVLPPLSRGDPGAGQ